MKKKWIKEINCSASNWFIFNELPTYLKSEILFLEVKKESIQCLESSTEYHLPKTLFPFHERENLGKIKYLIKEHIIVSLNNFPRLLYFLLFH